MDESFVSLYFIILIIVINKWNALIYIYIYIHCKMREEL